jgi:signal transduction histidine kinase
MPLEIETHLFYVAQEALMNVFSHSGSAQAVVRLQRRAEEAILQVEDFGQGMAETGSAMGNRKTGFGIARMHERLRTIGGVIEIESDFRGTFVTARVRL